jgi:hypothetical protein
MLRHHMIEPLADVRFSDVNEFPPICRRPMTLVPVNLSPEKIEYRRLNFLNETLALIHGTLRLVVCRLVKARAIPLIGVTARSTASYRGVARYTTVFDVEYVVARSKGLHAA